MLGEMKMRSAESFRKLNPGVLESELPVLSTG